MKKTNQMTLQSIQKEFSLEVMIKGEKQQRE